MTSVAAPIRERLLFALRAFLWTAFAASIGVGLLVARQRQQDSRRHMVDLGVWSVLSTPEWTSDADLHAIRTTSGLPGHAMAMFDRSAAAAMRSRLEATPRVRRVLGLRRRLPDRVEVVVELRRPVAAVLFQGEGGGYVEVDAEGIALGEPVRERPWRLGKPLRVITGTPGGPPAAGRPFGPDVASAIRLCLALEGYGTPVEQTQFALVDEVDLANVRGRLDPFASEVLLRAHPPDPYRPAPMACVVEWGRLPRPRVGDPDAGPDGDLDGEAPFAEKAGRLARALRLFPTLSGLERVRVAFADLIVIPVGGTGPGTPWLPSEPRRDRSR